TPTFPPAVKAGQMGLAANLTIAWANNGVNVGHGNNVSAIKLTPQCGTFAVSTDCPAASQEPGLITLSSSGTGSGCGAVTTFTITPDVTGEVTITPGFDLPVNGVCTINFTLNINGTATKDANPARSGVQTAVLAGATANDDVTNAPGGGLGSA